VRIGLSFAVVVVAFASAGSVRGAEEIRSLASRLEVVSIHVRDHAAFDAVLRLLGEELQLPLIFGAPSKPEQRGKTLYARFSVGNAGLEPCGPYASDAPFVESAVARFYGLTFRAVEPLADALTELRRRGLHDASLVPPPKNIPDPTRPRFLTVRDPAIASNRRGASLWDLRDSARGDGEMTMQRMLTAAGGGALGVVRLEEVWLGGTDAFARTKWRALLAPATDDGDVFRVGDGPALRFFPGGASDLRAIVLKVKSRAAAMAFLRARQMLGAVRPDSAELDPARACGLRIILRE